MQQELDLFRFRFSRENADSRDDFLRENDLNYEPVNHFLSSSHVL
jgi:hypothetical protein